MQTYRVLPDELVAQPFTPATAAAYGVSRKRLESSWLYRPAHGARCTRSPTSAQELAAGVCAAMPEDVVLSHLTAARVWGFPLATRWDEREPIDAMRSFGRTRIRRHNVRGHLGAQSRRICRVDGLAVTSPADTWCDLAGELDLTQLVVIGDHLAGSAGYVVPIDELRSTLRSRGRTPGSPVLLRALDMIRPRSRSPMETWARLLFADGGLPEPELNVRLLDDRGQWLGVPDFVWRGRRVAAEFDGDHHRTDPRQWRRDVLRREDILAAGWWLVILTADDILRRPAKTISRLADVLLPVPSAGAERASPLTAVPHAS